MDLAESRDQVAAAPTLALLDLIEAWALKIYGECGLPQEPGLYMKSRRQKRWKFISPTLSPEQRWDLVLKHPLKDGWRFGSLEDLGRQHAGASPRLISAAEALASCKRLRERLQQSSAGIAEDVERAIQLGRSWHEITWEPGPGHVRLRFQPTPHDGGVGRPTPARRKKQG